MKENIMLIASLIIIGTTLFLVGFVVLEMIKERKDRKKQEEAEKEVQTLRLDMKKGDKQAELKLKEQLLHFESRYEKAKREADKAEEQLNEFKRIFDLYCPDYQEELLTISIPKNITSLSYDNKENNERVFLYSDELSRFLASQEEAKEEVS